MEDQLQVLLSEEEDAERVERLARYLREELLQLDTDEVAEVASQPVSAEAPAGARAGALTEIGALLVSLGGSATALRQVVTVVRDWWGRCREPRPSVRLALDDDILEISQATPEQVTEAFDLFVRRHSPLGA